MRDFLKICAVAPIHLYKRVISPVLGPTCRFSPSCSAYTLRAVELHGVLKGLFLGLQRIGKCHPWHQCSCHDPVPEEFHWPRLEWKRWIGYNRLVRWLEI